MSTSKPLHLLLDARMAQWSGIGRYTRGLVGALSELTASEQLRLTLITAPGQDVFGRRLNVEKVMAHKPPLSMAGLRELSKLTQRVAPDLLHCVHISTPRPKVSIPVITTLHDLTPLVIEDTMPSAAKRRVYRWLNKRAVQNSAQLITPSLHTAHDVQRFFPKAEGKITIVPEAADDFSGQGKEVIPGIVAQLPPLQFFLSMGNVKPHKNLETLLKAYDAYCVAAVRQRLCDPELTPYLFLVGKGSPKYLDAHLSPRARGKVFFTGATDDSQLRWLYAHTLAFIFPSRYEGFGLPLLEAASFGAPLLAARSSSLFEVAGEAAAYFEPMDTSALTDLLLRVSREQSFVDGLSERASAQSRNFSWVQTALHTLEAYRKALKPSC